MYKILQKIFYPELKPLTEPAKKLIIFLHGYGSDGDDLISLAHIMQKKLINFFFIAPHGIEPYELAPSGREFLKHGIDPYKQIPQGRQWFSLTDHTPAVLADLVAKSSTKLQEIIENKQNQLGLSNKDTILIGFSQGTMLALQSTLTQKNEPFAATIGFSGLLIYPQECLNRKTPICLIHGQEDNVIDISQMDLAKKYFDEHGINYETLSIHNLKHSVSADGIDKAIEFIQKWVKV